MLHTLSLHNVLCQLNKAGKNNKIKKEKKLKIWEDHNYMIHHKHLLFNIILVLNDVMAFKFLKISNWPKYSLMHLFIYTSTHKCLLDICYMSVIVSAVTQ